MYIIELVKSGANIIANTVSAGLSLPFTFAANEIITAIKGGSRLIKAGVKSVKSTKGKNRRKAARQIVESAVLYHDSKALELMDEFGLKESVAKMHKRKGMVSTGEMTDKEWKTKYATYKGEKWLKWESIIFVKLRKPSLIWTHSLLF